MRRTHRAVFLLFALILLATAVTLRPTMRAAADDSVILTVSGYRINTPQRGLMPFFTSTNLFAPLSMFTDMGVTVTEQAGLLILSNVRAGRILYFDLNAKTASDGSGTYELEPIKRNGQWFVPFIFTASRMNFEYSYVNASPAPFLRINYPDDTLMTDDAFMRYYESVVPHLLESIQTTATAVTHPTTPAETTATTRATTAATTSRPPETTSKTSATTPPQTEPPTETTTEATTEATTPPPKEYTAYLVIDGLARAEDAMTALRRAGLSAVFRVDPASAAENGSALRAVIAAGYGIVWAVDDSTAPESLDAANRLLFDCCRTVTKTAVARSPLSAAANRLLAAQGYSVWAADLTIRTAPADGARYPAPSGRSGVLLVNSHAAQLLTKLSDLLDGLPTFARLSMLCAR